MASAQLILHYTETSGYDHGTRDVSLAMFQAIASEQGWTVVQDNDGTAFDTPASLDQFDAVIFSNTSGNDLLTAAQRTNFEQWVGNGGHVLGIHAASDTYRHGTANGGNTGTWDFYAELIGASVQENPNHVDGILEYAMEHIGLHGSTANLPDPWVKFEEYYYWEHGYFGPDNTEVLRVEETVGPNGQVNSYDAPRAMSWYRELPGGSRVFYTALGHAQSNYTDDMLFRQHMKDALIWMLGSTTGIVHGTSPVPCSVINDGNSLTIATGGIGAIRITDAAGRVMHADHAQALHRIRIQDWKSGIYHLTVGAHTTTVVITR